MRGGAIALVGKKVEYVDKPDNDSILTVDRVRQIILENVPTDGSSIGNIKLIRRLSKHKVKDDFYWAARNELIREGKLVKGRGMGGSVSLPEKKEVTPKDTSSKKKYRKEKDLYSPFEKTIREYWTRENNFDPRRCVVEITANQGSRKTGGKWTRPDITVIAVSTFRFVPGKTLDVITFEIKPSNDLDIVGVFETASHSRFAAKSYLAVHLPDGITESLKPQIEVLSNECERFGIGFLYFLDPSKPGTWETILEPARKTPDPTEIDNFLSIQLSRKNQDEVHRML